MLLILTGEGPSDIGICRRPIGICRNHDFGFGPMSLIVDQIALRRLGYSVLRDTPDRAVFVSKFALTDEICRMKGNRRIVALTGKKAGQETGFHMKYAWAFGKVAAEIEGREEDIGVAVFFRDTDNTNANPSGSWDEKWDSIERGFLRALYLRGVPMLPKPTSEAWLLCAAQQHPYQRCAEFEELPGNVVSQSHPKEKLKEAFGAPKDAAELCDWLSENPLDIDRANSMPSFLRFSKRLNEALGQVAAA